MPVIPVEELTTTQIIAELGVLAAQGETVYTLPELSDELESRVDTTPESPTLGFIRPTKPNL